MKKLFQIALALSLTLLLTLSSVSAAEVLDSFDPVGDTGKSALGAESLDLENMVEGTGCFTVTNPNPIIFELTLETPIDLSAYEDDLVLDFWIYIENIDTFGTGDGQLEMTSSGTCDVDELCWLMTNVVEDYGWTTGWNHAILTQEQSGGDDLDYSAVNFIRFYHFFDEGQTIKIDNLKVGHASEYGIGEVEIDRSSETLFDFDDFRPADASDDLILGENALTGTGNPAVAQKVYETPIDVSKYFTEKDINGDCDGYIYLWLWLEGYDAENPAADEGQLELSSSGECDIAETHIGVYSMAETLQNGWNELLIPLSAFTNESSTDAVFDPAAVNFLRLYFFGQSDVTVKIDNVKFGLSEDFGIYVKSNATEPPATEAPATEAPATTAAGTETDSPAAENNNNTILWIAVGAAAVVIIAVVVVIVVKKKK